MSYSVPSKSGFRRFHITYQWICAKCEFEATTYYEGRPGDAVVAPMTPIGWTVTFNGVLFLAYCPKHVIRTLVVELPLSDTATAPGTAAGSGRDAHPQADAGELPTQTAACGGLTSS